MSKLQAYHKLALCRQFYAIIMRSLFLQKRHIVAINVDIQWQDIVWFKTVQHIRTHTNEFVLNSVYNMMMAHESSF